MFWNPSSPSTTTRQKMDCLKGVLMNLLRRAMSLNSYEMIWEIKGPEFDAKPITCTPRTTLKQTYEFDFKHFPKTKIIGTRYDGKALRCLSSLTPKPPMPGPPARILLLPSVFPNPIPPAECTGNRELLSIPPLARVTPSNTLL
ncbi:hypothetical protein J437_LFUL004711 [Ladona fulva]|uniref:Uncharacterized protein n=1 Tax=Ladona fulva TaxID=123851 RepID=A0A8K0KV21_LADFU|nr:hypothetical protein J437_LFUL004711 [Ladona fulva]